MFTGNKSLLLGSGLLILFLYLLYHSLPGHDIVIHSVPVNITASRIVNTSESENYLATMLGELFPVLKKLNFM